ncbi:DUF3800 domain-containing protein [Luteimonas sp. BDR2-5]|nr:DUF3800 domain-containing protein [Luteimonas sp. BDR2-5]
MGDNSASQRGHAERMPGDIVYIDESGHTGDLLKPGTAFDFSGQPHFVLAGVGPMDAARAAALLDQIGSRHRLRMREVKSDRLQTRPAFVRDLFAALRDHDVPLFVEAVDKAFFLMIQIVNCHVMPPTGGTQGDEEDLIVRNAFADFLYQSLPDTVLARFIDACRADNADAVRVSLDALLDWARSEHGGNEEEAAIVRGIEENVVESIDDFERAVAGQPDGYRRFLPIPDAGKRDRLYWMLPNYSSLTNLYARVNRYRQGRLSGLTLVHDEQAQYDDIIRTAKAAVERFEDVSWVVQPGADYAFGETAALSFGNSAESPGLMIADVVAGHVRRVLRDHMAERALGNTAFDALLTLWDVDPTRGAGLNLVLPTAAVQRLQMKALARRAGLRER